MRHVDYLQRIDKKRIKPIHEVQETILWVKPFTPDHIQNSEVSANTVPSKDAFHLAIAVRHVGHVKWDRWAIREQIWCWIVRLTTNKWKCQLQKTTTQIFIFKIYF